MVGGGDRETFQTSTPDQARKACRQIAKNRDWKGIDADVRKESGNRIVVMMTGERKGQDRDRRCVYNTKTNEAQFEDQ